MKLHGNASLPPAAVAVSAGDEQGWSVAQAAEAAGVSERTGQVAGRAFGRRAIAGLAIGSAAARSAGADRRWTGSRRRRVAAAADHGGRDRRGVVDAALDCLGGLDPIGLGRRSPLKPLEPRIATSATAGRARPRRHQEARADRMVSATASSADAPADTQTAPTAAASAHRLRVRARLRRRRDPPRLRRGPRRRERHHGRRLPAPRRRALHGLRHPRRARAHRQRLGLPPPIHRRSPAALLGLRHLRTRPLAAPDQREGRTLHPNAPRWLGLRRHLRPPATNAHAPSPAGSTSTIDRRPHGSLSRQAPMMRLHALMNNALRVLHRVASRPRE